jgi:hypothetical protein
MGMAGAGGLPLFIKLSLCLGDEGKKTADYFIPEALVTILPPPFDFPILSSPPEDQELRCSQFFSFLIFIKE